MARPKNLAPTLQQHRDGRYYTRIEGVFHSLGKDPVQARRRFGELLASPPKVPDPTREVQTVGSVLAAWLEARGPRVDWRQRHRMGEAVEACRDWHDTPFGEFRQRQLRAARSLLLARPNRRTGEPLSRRYVNHVVKLVQTAARWAASEDLISPAERDAVCAVQPLKKGEGGVEVPRRQPANPRAVAAALEVLPPPMAALVRLQLLTGARPGEMCSLRPCDLTRFAVATDQGPELWLAYQPQRHKTQRLGKARLIVLSPAAQEALAPFLDGPPDACPFPARGVYGRAVQAACAAAGVEPFTPHQLRHAAATAMQDAGASEGDAAAALGHSAVGTTRGYTHALLQAAARAAEKLREK